jgi:hypothetical protein
MQVEMNPAALGGPAKVAKVRYLEPGAEPRELHFVQGPDGRLRFEVPSLEIWGIVSIE